MTADELRDLCLSFMGTEETFPFSPGTSVFKVAGKVFALAALGAEPLTVSLKCDPGLAEQLREAHSAITPGYHLNKRHWNTVLLDGSLEDQIVADMVEDSYDLVVSGLPDMESCLSSGDRVFVACALVGSGGCWSAGWVAARVAVRDAGQTDMRGSGWPQDHGSSWGAAV